MKGARAATDSIDRASIGPSEFVPIAEQLNLIDDINRHLMGLAFEAAKHWPANIKLAFNLSAIQLCSKGSAKAVLHALSAAGLPPEKLQAEVTETALLADFNRARANLTELKHAGATIVLDDFGAGYASIGYLRELRFDQIKLDGVLVTAAQRSADGKRLLRAVIGLCEIPRSVDGCRACRKRGTAGARRRSRLRGGPGILARGAASRRGAREPPQGASDPRQARPKSGLRRELAVPLRHRAGACGPDQH